MNRRVFLKMLGLQSAGLSLSTRLLQADTGTSRPNIIVILADDMGFSDIGCYGGEISTPNIDKMAAQGLRFSQFYNTARCCPTRASLLTGLYQHEVGIGLMTADRGLPAYRGFLNRRCITIAEGLQPVGYRNIMIGKWHVGGQKEHWPLKRGFHRFYGLPTGGGVYFWPPTRFRSRQVVLNDTVTNPPQGWYSTDAFTEYALKFMEEAHHDRTPFFMYVAYISPHFPLQAHPKDISRYRGKYMQGWEHLRQQRYRRLIELGIIDRKWPLSPLDARRWSNIRDKERMDLKMAIYAAQIECMDRNIGRIMDKLQSLGIDDNTLVIFLSDNGGTSEGGLTGFDYVKNAELGTAASFSSYGQGWANASNTPFRLFKKWVHEGGIATPLIARWPAVIHEKGKITRQVGHVIDIMATCLDVAGTTYLQKYQGHDIMPTEGLSLLPIFRGQKRQGHKFLFWEHMGNRAVRQGDWKLVSRNRSRWELYDLAADRTELNDLHDKYPDKTRELVQAWDNWAKRCGVVPFEKLIHRKRKSSRRKTQ